MKVTFTGKNPISKATTFAQPKVYISSPVEPKLMQDIADFKKVKTVGILNKNGLIQNLIKYRNKIIKEITNFPVEGLKEGDQIKVDIFQTGDVVKVTGISKGKGFQGVVKRHGFAGGVRTHGQSDRERAPGSIGSSSYPSRVLKGMRMAGRMGGKRITVRNLKIIKIIPDSNLLLVKGAIPGANTGYVEIYKN